MQRIVVPEPTAWMLFVAAVPLLLGCSRQSMAQSGAQSPAAPRETRGESDIPLVEILTTGPQEGMKTFQGESGYLRQIRQDTRGGSSNVFLVDATNAEDAVRASFDILLGGGNAGVAAPVSTENPARGSHWLVAYLGIGPSNPVWWTMESVTSQGKSIRLTYRQSPPQPATADSHPYYYWVPLGKLAPGIYQVELFDADENAVALMRRVKVEDAPD